MLTIRIQLHRPFDRDPSSHFYGEPFDAAIDAAIGGRERWSSARDDQPDKPRAEIAGPHLSVELHEDGPVFDFIIQHWDQIPNYVNAIAAVVTAWAATRALKKSSLPPGDSRAKGGTVVQIDDLRIESERILPAEGLAALVKAVASTRMNSETRSTMPNPPPPADAKKAARLRRKR